MQQQSGWVEKAFVRFTGSRHRHGDRNMSSRLEPSPYVPAAKACTDSECCSRGLSPYRVSQISPAQMRLFRLFQANGGGTCFSSNRLRLGQAPSQRHNAGGMEISHPTFRVAELCNPGLAIPTIRYSDPTPPMQCGDLLNCHFKGRFYPICIALAAQNRRLTFSHFNMGSW